MVHFQWVAKYCNQSLGQRLMREGSVPARLEGFIVELHGLVNCASKERWSFT
jgi:hypothetical protein